MISIVFYSASILAVVTIFLVHTIATQVPFHSSYAEWQSATFDDDDLGSWSLNTYPNADFTDHLVFETVHSLLQRWPNTRMRNGHAVVPGIIPMGTLLYHGTSSNVLPTNHEWFATDPEFAYVFCGGSPKKECWQFTLMTTRPLKVVYFDGSSAAKMQDGPLDTQDLLLWGETRGGALEEDMQRIEDICRWGERHGVDAFVRMQVDFEVMLCDPTSGVEVVSSLNLEPRLTRWPQEKVLVQIATLDLMNAASCHNRFPGETRVQLNLAGLVTFYDTQLAPSLVSVRGGQERWDHRVQNISSEDLSTAKAKLEEALSRPEGLSSGIDWATLIQVVVDRYAERLELVRYLLSTPTTNPDNVLGLANKTQTQLRTMLTPYLFRSAVSRDPRNETDIDWVAPVFRLCATTHTYFMDSRLPVLTDSERLILRAVRGTTREICRVVTKMWVAGVHAGVDQISSRKEYPDIARVTHLRNTWFRDLSSLMRWLDWSEWVKCDPACGPEEVCYLPTWPVGFPGGDKIPYVGPIFPPVTDEWMRPQPKCINRVVQYGY